MIKLTEFYLPLDCCKVWWHNIRQPIEEKCIVFSGGSRVASNHRASLCGVVGNTCRIFRMRILNANHTVTAVHFLHTNQHRFYYLSVLGHHTRNGNVAIRSKHYYHSSRIMNWFWLGTKTWINNDARVDIWCEKEVYYRCCVTNACVGLQEGLPKTVDHDWIMTTLSKYDTVNYVSLPRYPTTKTIKGFAFVEFATVAGVKACLDAVGTKEFGSVNPFPKDGSKDIQRLQKCVKKAGRPWVIAYPWLCMSLIIHIFWVRSFYIKLGITWHERKEIIICNHVRIHQLFPIGLSKCFQMNSTLAWY